jgi:tape measure domain-containing protein
MSAAGVRAEASAGKLTNEIRRSTREVQSLGSAIRSLSGLLSGALSARAIVNIADATTNLQSGLKLVADNAQQVGMAQAGLLEISQRTRSSYTELGKTYTSLARAAEPLQLSQERLLGITKAIAQASQIGGGSSSSINAALIQLGQGISSGTLRGEELNSVLEQTPRLARAIAEGIGVPVGRLRQLAEDGRLTSEVVLQAIERSASTLDREFSQLTPTIDGALTTLNNGLAKTIEEFEKSTGLFRRLAEGIVSVSSALVDVARYFGEASRAGNGFFEGLGQGARQLVSGESAVSLGAKIAPLQAQRAQLAQRQAQGGFTPEDAKKLGQINAEIAGYQRQLKLVQALTKSESERQSAAVQTQAQGAVVALPQPKATGQASAAAAARREAQRQQDLRLLAAEQLLGTDDAQLSFNADVERAYADFDRTRKAANDEAIRQANAQEEAVGSLAERYRDLADPTRQYRQEIQLVTALEAQGRLTAEEAFNARLRLVEQEESALERTTKQLKDQKSVVEQLGLTFTSALEDAIVNFKSLGDVARGVLQDIARMLVRESITAPLAKSFKDSGIGSSIGSFFSGLFKFAGGGYVSGAGTATSDSIPARLSNGEFVVRADSVRKVGVSTLNAINDSGYVPRRFAAGGLVTGAGAAVQPGATQTVQANFYLSPGTSIDDFRRSKRQIESDLARTVRRAAA